MLENHWRKNVHNTNLMEKPMKKCDIGCVHFPAKVTICFKKWKLGDPIDKIIYCDIYVKENMSYGIKQVIVVRKDLNMRKGKIAAQVAHASMKILLDQMSKSRKHGWIEKWNGGMIETTNIIRTLDISEKSYLNEWLNGAFTKVVVSCDSQEELMVLQLKANEAKIPAARITDAGKTEFKGVPTVTCLAIGPYDSKEIDKITGDLKLL